MPGSFMPVCLLVFLGISFFAPFLQHAPRTALVLRCIQSIAVSGSVVEILIEFFDGLIKGVTLACLMGALYFLFAICHINFLWQERG